MPVPDYDNLLIGQYIKAIENPNHHGLVGNKWIKSPYKGDDENNRGYGVDVVHNKAAAKVVRGRKDKHLTVGEEKQLRNAHIDEVSRAQRENYHEYLRKKELSDAKKIMGIGLLYRGDSINEDKTLSDAYYNGTDLEFQKAVDDYYRSKGLNERARQHTQFMDENANEDKSWDVKNIIKNMPVFEPQNTYAEGGTLDAPQQWDDLSLDDKSEIMRIAVSHGIQDLQEIRDRWNEFADEGYEDTAGEYAEGGYMPSKQLRKDIADWEGSSMKTNRSFEDEARDFNRVIPASIRSKLSQQQLDSLYSYGYNVGMGNLRKRVLPTLKAYTEGYAGAEDVASQMWAAKDPVLRGLQRRRSWEKNMFIGASPEERRGSIVDQALHADLSSLPTEEVPFDASLFPPNPTSYNTPSYPVFKDNQTAYPVEEKVRRKSDNLLPFMRLVGLLDSPEEDTLTASYAPQRPRSPYVADSTLDESNSMLDSSWFKKGGYLYGEGGPEWTRVRSGNKYGYVRTDSEGHPVDFDKNTGYFTVYDSPDTDSHSYSSYSLPEKETASISFDSTYNGGELPEFTVTGGYAGIERTPDDHTVALARDKAVDDYVKSVVPSAGDFIGLGDPVGLIPNPFKITEYSSNGDTYGLLNEAGKAAFAGPKLAQSAAGMYYGITGLANENGIPKTIDYFNNGEYGRGAASALGDVANAGMAFIGGRGLYNDAGSLVNNIRDYINIKHFINRYEYKYHPKPGLILDGDKLDRLTEQLVKQHNTFARGVDVREARKYYGFPKTMSDEEIAKYTLTHAHRPSAMNAGGNPDKKPVLYTSNSIDLAKAYTNGDGYVGILQRPITYHPNRSKMLKLNDFRFYRNNNKHFSGTTDEPFILRKGEGAPAHPRNKGTYARRVKGKVRQMFEATPATGLDALAHQGSEIVSMRRPDDVNFRHYLFLGDEAQPLLNLEYMFKNTNEVPVTDYAKYSIGLSRKKDLGGKL